jgi:CheY-like chemotaxis protein
VSSGKEAILKLQADVTYDLVLMDIQMPEMDGMETTKQLKDLNIIDLPPIIAMTAYAMKEDRDRFLSVGMDDYLAKPIRAQSLIEMVIQWVTGKKTKNQKKKAGESIKNKTSLVLDIDVINSLSEAMGGDLAFVKGMLAEFIIEAKAQIETAEMAFNQQKKVLQEIKDSKKISEELYEDNLDLKKIKLKNLEYKVYMI